jgi:foldase protein PrsA
MKTRSWVIRGVVAGLIATALLGLGSCGGGLPKGSIAQVGQVFISEKQFEELKSLYEAVGRAPDKDAQKDEYERFEQSVAEYLVKMEVLAQQASAYKIEVTDADVEAAIAEIKQMFQGDEARFEEALKKQHLSLEQFTEQTRDRLLLDKMRAAVTADVEVTEAELKAYYEANKDDYVQPEEREVRHILIAVGGADGESAPTQADWEAAKKEADKIRAEVQNGANFRATAEKYSDDEATRSSGGRLGTVTPGQTVPEFEEAVFSLKKGEISQPVKTQYGYHIIQVTEITPEEQLPFDRVRDGIWTALMEQKTEEAWQSWLAEKQVELGVVYLSGLEPTTPVTTRTTIDEVTEEQMGDAEPAGDRGADTGSETTGSAQE